MLALRRRRRESGASVGRWGKTLFVAGIVGYVVGERPSVGKERAKALADPRL